MDNRKFKQALFPIIIPGILLIIIIVGVVILYFVDYDFTEYLILFILAFSGFLITQIARNIIKEVQYRKAYKELETAKVLATSGREIEAIKRYKKLLYKIPAHQYSLVTTELYKVYKMLKMTNAKIQIKRLEKKALDYFEMSKNFRRMNREEKIEFRNLGDELSLLINKLPTSPNGTKK